MLAALKDRWQGTLVFIGQPAEEIGAGAGRCSRTACSRSSRGPTTAWPCTATAAIPHGHVAYTEGLAMANVDSVDIIVQGKGGHGAAPHTTIDPDRPGGPHRPRPANARQPRDQPDRPGRVTVGSIHGGTKHNIIPDEVKLQLTVRTHEGRRRASTSWRHRAHRQGGGAGARAPEPIVDDRSRGVHAGAVQRPGADAQDGGRCSRRCWGRTTCTSGRRSMGGEDFGRYAAPGVPIFLYFLGTQPPDRRGRGEQAGRQAAAVAALGPFYSGAGADHRDRRADDEHGGAEPGGKKSSSLSGRIELALALHHRTQLGDLRGVLRGQIVRFHRVVAQIVQLCLAGCFVATIRASSRRA